MGRDLNHCFEFGTTTRKECNKKDYVAALSMKISCTQPIFGNEHNDYLGILLYTNCASYLSSHKDLLD